jgi:hypothetical protein
MRQAFLNGALTRLADPDNVPRQKIAEFVAKGDFGLASGQKADGTFERIWFEKPVSTEEVAFDAQVFLLTKQRAKGLLAGKSIEPAIGVKTENAGITTVQPATTEGETAGRGEDSGQTSGSRISTIRVSGRITPEVWNKLGVRILPRLKGGNKVSLGIDFSCEVAASDAAAIQAELRQAIADLRLDSTVRVLGD